MTNTIFTLNSPCSRPSISPHCERVKRLVTLARFEHIVRVAILAETIARANGFCEGDIRATALAAVLHDAARDLSEAELLRLAPPENALEQKHPLAVHGRAARRLAESWGIGDLRVLDAVEGHVFGVSHDNRIGMAVYIADVSEPGRGVNADIRELAMRDLAKAYGRAVDSKVRYLRAQGKAVHPSTLKVHRELYDAAPDAVS
ncbi:bis(5'-nucleosyl)-tetraphosphatase (symmetrical) YqeK [soil metagenome]